LKANRNCAISLKAVASVSGNKLHFVETVEGEFSSLRSFAESDMFAQYRMKNTSSEYLVDTISLNDLIKENDQNIQIGDSFSIEYDGFLLESTVIDILSDGPVIAIDDVGLAYIPTEIDEAKYQGRTVPLGKPMRGDVKKFKVYVRNPQGNIVKVNFGDPNMKIKKSNPARRRSFRARHNCDNPGPRTKARYWSCRKW
jgi:hypothetical protein